MFEPKFLIHIPLQEFRRGIPLLYRLIKIKIMENINWANEFASRAKELEDKKKSKTQSNEDWLQYFKDFVNGFNRVKSN